MHSIIKSKSIVVEEAPVRSLHERSSAPDEPQVELVKTGDHVHAIELTCPCGAVHVVEIDYPAGAESPPATSLTEETA